MNRSDCIARAEYKEESSDFNFRKWKPVRSENGVSCSA